MTRVTYIRRGEVNHVKVVYESIMGRLKGETLSEPILVRPDPTNNLYMITDWSKEGMGDSLLQTENQKYPPNQRSNR